MIICTDEEWDIKGLQSGQSVGSDATPEEIVALANSTYDRIYGIIACDFISAKVLNTFPIRFNDFCAFSKLLLRILMPT